VVAEKAHGIGQRTFADVRSFQRDVAVAGAEERPQECRLARLARAGD
jgi:hypothetical protein